jgi:hypothetical protein
MAKKIGIGRTQKYDALLTILDQIRREAPSEYKSYRPLESQIPKLDAARSRAFIHLFLKVRFGLLGFLDREQYITEGTQDGGVDAYYIDRDNKKAYFIQAKFRTSRENFDTKNIDLEDLLKMDVARITEGEAVDEHGVRYNSKIQNLIRQIQEIEDVARYKFEIVLLANLKEIPRTKLRRLLGEFHIEVLDHSRCYSELVFPVISGTYYNASDLHINIDLSNKDFSQAKIRYPVETEFSSCEITIIFVPTIEIAKVLYKYRNSILRYNPRSYLSLSSNSVNRDIAATITNKKSNEFAIFNNGITMLSDETSFSERTGKQYRGRLHVTNPQIINGGQTAYTLSHIYEESLGKGSNEEIFESKEVMLKVITLTDPEIDDEKRLRLIEAISKATNQQTSVVEADRRSNDKIQIELQKRLYEDFGFFYERKKGEFFDGLRSKYIGKDKVIDRELFLRAGLAIMGNPSSARRSSIKRLFAKDSFDGILSRSVNYRRLFFAYLCYIRLEEMQKEFNRDQNNRYGVVNFGNAIRYGKFSVVSIANAMLREEPSSANIEGLVEDKLNRTLERWLAFEEYARQLPTNKEHFRKVTDPETGKETIETNFDSYYKVQNVKRDLERFFSVRLNS